MRTVALIFGGFVLLAIATDEQRAVVSGRPAWLGARDATAKSFRASK